MALLERAFPSSIRLLLWLHFYAALRKMAQFYRSTAGITIAIWLGCCLYLSLAIKYDPIKLGQAVQQDLSQYAGIWLFYIFLFSFLGGFQRGFYVSPQENQFLRNAPIEDRHFIAYRLIRTCLSSAIFALFFSLIARIAFGTFAAAFLRAFPAMLGLEFFPYAIAALCQRLNWETRDLLRKLARLTFLALLAYLVFSFTDLAKTIPWIPRPDWAYEKLALFYWAGSLLFGSGWLATAQWFGITATFSLLCSFFIFRFVDLKDDFSIERNRVAAERLERIRNRRGSHTPAKWQRVGVELQDFPAMGGIGPILWLHCQWIARNGFLLAFLVALPLLAQRYVIQELLIKSAGNWAKFQMTEFFVFTLLAACIPLVRSVSPHVISRRIELFKSLPFTASQVVMAETIITSLYAFLATGLCIVLTHRITSQYFPDRFDPVLIAFLFWGVPLTVLHSTAQSFVVYSFPSRLERPTDSFIVLIQGIVGGSIFVGLISLSLAAIWGCLKVGLFIGSPITIAVIVPVLIFAALAYLSFWLAVGAYRRLDYAKVSRQ